MIIEASLRTNLGSSKSRFLRKQGLIPAVVYGCEKPQEIVSVHFSAIDRIIKEHSSMSRVFSLAINGRQESVLIKDIQFHPVTSEPLHVDFFRVNDQTPVCVLVPLVFINEDKSPGLKRGCTLNVVKRHVKVFSTASTIPTHINVDLLGVEANTSITLGSLKFPKDVQPKGDPSLTLATIVAKKQKD